MKIVREHINEKFTEDSDPIQDMGIGTLAQIDKFIQENDTDEYVKIGIESRAEYLSQINDVDKKQLKEWIEFLLRHTNENPQRWNDEYAQNMVDLNVNFAENLDKFSDNSFSFEKDESDNKYFLYVDEWEDFKDMFQYDSRNTASKQYVTAILNADALEYFENYDPDLDDILYELDETQQQKLFSFLIEKFPQLKSTKTSNLKDLLEYIDENKRSLKEIIIRSFANYMAIVNENGAFKHIVELIKNHFDITDELKDSSSLKFKITQKGLNKLFGARFQHSDSLIWYYADLDNFDKDFDIDEFIEEIEQHI